MKNLFISHFFIFSLILAGTSDFDKGLEHYKSRSESAVGYNVKSEPIDNAIKQFKKASIDMELDAGIYLMRSYYFKGKFIAKTDEEKKKVFSKGKDLGDMVIFSDRILSETGTVTLDDMSLEKISKEVEEAKKLFKKYNWPTVDVTRKSVEETAASVIKIYEISKNND